MIILLLLFSMSNLSEICILTILFIIILKVEPFYDRGQKAVLSSYGRSWITANLYPLGIISRPVSYSYQQPRDLSRKEPGRFKKIGRPEENPKSFATLQLLTSMKVHVEYFEIVYSFMAILTLYFCEMKLSCCLDV